MLKNFSISSQKFFFLYDWREMLLEIIIFHLTSAVFGAWGPCSVTCGGGTRQKICSGG